MFKIVFSTSRKMIFNVEGAWHYPYTAPSIVHGQPFRIMTWQRPH